MVKRVSIGVYFGYPQCCVDAFLTDECAIHAVARPEDLPFCGTGFIPCRTCYETKTPEQLLQEIASARQCPVPFPNGDGEEYWAAQRMGGTDHDAAENVYPETTFGDSM